jgi:hypothetical protein
MSVGEKNEIEKKFERKGKMRETVSVCQKNKKKDKKGTCGVTVA